jgi:hypothetical protein
MSPQARASAAAVAVAIIAAAFFGYEARLERPGAPRSASSTSAATAASSPPIPLTAHEVLEQRLTVGLRRMQIVRLEALDRQWTRERSALQARIHDAEREFSVFAGESRNGGRVGLAEIQERSSELRQLSAQLRKDRAHHADAVSRVLDEWQRERLIRSRAQATEGRTHDVARN